MLIPTRFGSYIGNPPKQQSHIVDDFVGDGVTVNYNISYNPGSSRALLVAISGVLKNAEVDYTVSNKVLTFITAPANSAKIHVIYLGIGTDINTVRAEGCIVKATSTRPETNVQSLYEDLLNASDTRKGVSILGRGLGIDTYQSGSALFATASGTSDSIIASVTPAPTVLTNGMQIHLRATSTSTTATPSLNLNSLGAKTITKVGGQPLALYDISTGCDYILSYNNAGTGRWELLNPRPSPFITGEIKMWAGAVASTPSGWLPCDGRSLNRSMYPDLFNVIGTAYGAVDGSSFSLPDMRGRVPVGTGQGSGLSWRPMGQYGGEENHVLNINEMPSHSHSYLNTRLAQDSPGTSSYQNGPQGNSFRGETTQWYNTQYTGSSWGHNNMQPYTVVNFMIKV